MKLATTGGADHTTDSAIVVTGAGEHAEVLSCRADKKTARKAVRQSKVQRKKSKKAQSSDSCMICGELFVDSRAGEQWIQCQMCSGWCHEDCTGGETACGFFCDFCCWSKIISCLKWPSLCADCYLVPLSQYFIVSLESRKILCWTVSIIHEEKSQKNPRAVSLSTAVDKYSLFSLRCYGHSIRTEREENIHVDSVILMLK